MPLERRNDTASHPHPVIHPETEEFWSRLAAGELSAQVCADCGTRRYPFAPVCFSCLSFEWTWSDIPAAGTVATAVVVRRATGEKSWASEVPFISSLVDMAPDLRLPGRILCDCGEALQRGTAVHAVVMDNPDRGPILGFAHGCGLGR